MKKSLLGYTFIGLGFGAFAGYWFGPKGDPLAKLLPAEKLVGYIDGTQVALIANAKGRSAAGGTLLMAEGWAPSGIEPHLLLPTVYGAMKAVLRQNRGADVIRLYLAEDSLLARAYQWVAVAEYRKGRLVVSGGFPSQAQIDSLKSLGMAAIRPTAEERKALAQVFDQTGGLAAERLKVSQALSIPPMGQSSANHFTLPLETPVLGAVGKPMGLKPNEFKETVLAINRYYWLRAGHILTVLE